MNLLRARRKATLVALEDACMVERGGDGKLHIKQAVNLTMSGLKTAGTRRAFWGDVVGIVFLSPLAGFVIGAVTDAGYGVLARSLANYGIANEFLVGLGEAIPVGSSALCVLLNNGDETELLSDLKKFRPRVLQTSLTEDTKRKLEVAFKELTQQA